jgi:hypothetical protein
MNQARALAAEAAVTGVLSRYLDRSLGVVLARTKGPKARRDTKWWVPTPGGPTLEVKALDPTYVVPAKLTEGLADDVRPVVTGIATNAARDISTRLGGDDDLFDSEEIARAIEEAIARILGVADRHARELRAAVLDADTAADSLDDLLDRVEAAHRRGGKWVMMAGRELANGLVNAAAYEQALRMGSTHAQWVSRRDGRVRPTHVAADGQTRRMEDLFKVGRFRLLHPCDPRDLPKSWEEIAGCRCGLIFKKADENARRKLEVVDRAIRDGSAPVVATTMLAEAIAAAEQAGETLTPTPQGYGLPPVAPLVTTTQPIVTYRQLDKPVDVIPGQWLTPPDQVVLGLAPPSEPNARTLAVLIPAGVVVIVAAGAVVLPAGTALDVLGVGADGIRTQVVAATERQNPAP